MPAISLLVRAHARSTTPDAGEIVEVLTDDSLTGSDWLRAGGIIVGSLAVAIITNRIVRHVLAKTVGASFAAIITARLIGYALFLVGLVYALNSLGVRVGPLLGALGLGGLVLALALQSVVENFVGGVILQTRRPFTVGDTVRLDDHVGIVTDIDARTTVLQGLDGSAIRVPNGVVLSNSIVNLTRMPLRRSEVDVGVAYDTDLAHATRVITDAADRTRRAVDHPAPLTVLRRFGESSIDFRVYFWHESDVPAELVATHDLILAIHQALADAGITIAFPQMVLWQGHDADEDPYGGLPDEVYTERPRLERSRVRPTDRNRRRFLRRRGG